MTAERIVSAQGTFMLARQKITIGKQHAHAVVQVTVDDGAIQVFHGGTLTRTVARTSDEQVVRHRYNERRHHAG